MDRRAESAILVDRGKHRRSDWHHRQRLVGVHVVHRDDGAVLDRHGRDPVREREWPVLGGFGDDQVGKVRIAGKVVGHIVDHVRRFRAGIAAAMPGIAVDVESEIRNPVGVEDDEGVRAALARARCPISFNALIGPSRVPFSGSMLSDSISDGTCVTLAARTSSPIDGALPRRMSRELRKRGCPRSCARSSLNGLAAWAALTRSRFACPRPTA